MGGIEQERILFAVRLPVCVNWPIVSPILVAVLKRDRMMVAFGLGRAMLSWGYLMCMDWGIRQMDIGM